MERPTSPNRGDAGEFSNHVTNGISLYPWESGDNTPPPLLTPEQVFWGHRVYGLGPDGMDQRNGGRCDPVLGQELPATIIQVKGNCTTLLE